MRDPCKVFDTVHPQVGARVHEFLLVFAVFGRFSLGSWPVVLPSRPYFRFCVLVAVLMPTETPPCTGYISSTDFPQTWVFPDNIGPG